MDLATLTEDKILSVYSGKPGCMCGCRGKHYYNPTHREEASKKRGYAVEDGEISPRMIKRVLGILQKTSSQVEYGARWISSDVGGRRYVIYFKD